MIYPLHAGCTLLCNKITGIAFKATTSAINITWNELGHVPGSPVALLIRIRYSYFDPNVWYINDVIGTRSSWSITGLPQSTKVNFGIQAVFYSKAGPETHFSATTESWFISLKMCCMLSSFFGGTPCEYSKLYMTMF